MRVAMPHFVDLHSHVLPALDDGSRGSDETREMLGLLFQVGFRTVCATPHQKAAQFLPTAEAIASAYEETRAHCEQSLAGLELLLGAENYWDDVFFTRARERTIPCYTGGKAFLFEIPTHATPPRLSDELFTHRARGLLPVLAHPERYADFDAARAEAIGRVAALVVDLGALSGAHGKRESRAAQRLVEDGAAHAAATDVHSPSDVQAAAAGIAWLRKRVGEARTNLLLEENPRRILSGELPELRS
jgi:protein-tyrosine phosphatase